MQPHRDVFKAALKFERNVELLSKHVAKGPTLADSDIWSIQACHHWSRTMHALKAVFRARFAKDSDTLTHAEKLCHDVHSAIAQNGFNTIRSAIKQNKRRRLEEPRTSSILAVLVAGTIQKHVRRLKDYLVKAHSWGQLESPNCNCCGSQATFDSQQMCITRLEALENVDLPWPHVIQEQVIFRRVPIMG